MNTLKLDSVSGFDIEIDGTIHRIERDVCAQHAPEIHAALGTSTESELQLCLDGLNYSYWFDGDRYLGRDEFGLGLRGDV